jgi:hypothetical protein
MHTADRTTNGANRVVVPGTLVVVRAQALATVLDLDIDERS